MLYSVILKNFTKVLDFSEEEGDFEEVLLGILKANNREKEFYYVQYLNYDFHFLHHEQFTFACITYQDIGMVSLTLYMEQVIQFLTSLKQHFLNIYTSERDQFTLQLSSVIKNLMDKFRQTANEDKFAKVEQELKLVEKEKHDILRETISKDACLDLLMPKVENLKKNVNVD